MVRAKFKVKAITQSVGWGQHSYSYRIELDPVVGGSPENDKFFNTTPSGSITMTILNGEAVKEFEVGKEVYVDFIPDR